MRKTRLKLILALLAFPLMLSAQIETVQYWFDSDFPGRTTQAVTPVATLQLSELNTTGLSVGLHLLHIRAKDNTSWSVVHSQLFYKLPVNPQAAALTSYEYWVDTNFTDKQQGTLSGQTAIINELDFPALGEGLHVLHIRAFDNLGRSSVVHSQLFYKTVAAENAMTAYEYWIDNNFEGCTSKTASGKTITINSLLENSTVAVGIHTVSIRAKDANGRWSVVHTQGFYKQEVIAGGNKIDAYRYWFDNDFAAHNPVTLETPVNPCELDTAYVLPAEFTAGETHTFHVQFRDLAGKWSMTSVDTFQIVAPAAIEVDSIRLNKTSATLFVGESDSLTYTISPANATNQNVTWNSSNASVATVVNGLVNAVSVGTAVIYVATEDGNKKDSCTVTVNPVIIPVTAISLNKPEMNLLVGASETLTYTISPANATNQNVAWSSSNANVATVTNGLVNAVSVGTAKIYVTTEDGNKKDSCTVTVSPVIISVTSVSLNKPATSLLVGGSETLTYTISPANATNQNVAWSSSNAGVATVTNGLVNAVSVGTAKIYVTTEDGSKKDSCAVTVNPVIIPVTAISLNKSATSLLVAENETLTYTISPENATNQNVAWSSSNANIATVQNGLVNAVSVGTAKIYVITESGNKTDSCTVTVEQVIIPVEYNVEYFFDTDPGFSQATGVASETLDLVSFNAPIADLSDGFHTLYVRAKNMNGWSQTQNRAFIKASLAADPGLNIEQVEYFIDADPGYGKGTSVDLGENNGVYAFNADMQPLADGFHTLYIRARNAENRWSQVMNRTFVKMILPSDWASGIQTMEYYLDTDPGTGKGISIPLPANSADINFTADLNSLLPGEHTLYIRILNPLNQWETVGSHTFTLIGVGIEAIDMPTIYPNPVSEFLFIKNERHSIQSVEMVDMSGQTVYLQPVRESNLITIPVAGYAPGAYVVKIVTHSGNTHIVKIIKK